MQINPEILRNYWLDFSFQRVIMFPVVLTAIFALGYLTSRGSVGPNQAFLSIAVTAVILYQIIIFIWGSYRASGAVLGEINDNTWDYQRLSSISPWTLAWGTVFGSTLYVWYGALICLGVFAVFAAPIMPRDIVIHSVITLLIAGVFNSAFVTLVGMQALQTSGKTSRRRLIGYRILGLIIGIQVWTLTGSILAKNDLYTWGFSYRNSAKLDYLVYIYGNGFHIETFCLISLFVFMLWALFAVYRSMRTELKMRSTPWGWAVFLLFLFFYLGGISTQEGPVWSQGDIAVLNSWQIGPVNVHQFFGMAFITSLISCYLMFFSDHLSITRYRMLQHNLTTGNMRRAAELIPRHSISYLYAAITGFALIALNPTIRIQEDAVPAIIGLLSLLLFLLRDIGILNYFSLAPNNRNAFMATLFYMVILYVLAPALLLAAKVKVAGLFYPVVGVTEWFHLIPIALQVILIGGLVMMRWRNADIPIRLQGKAAAGVS